MSKKPVIVFEGIEGSGKSFHISNVTKYLRKKKIKYIKLREPGGSLNSEKIRNLILDKKIEFNKNTDLLLYLAARSENITLLKKNFRKKIILIDRFVDSTIAYQHYGFGVDKQLIDIINRHLLGNLKVDFTFLNIVDKLNMFKRLKKRKNLNRYDKFDNFFYQKVQKGFLKLSKINRRKYQIIDSNLDKNLNRSLIIKKIDKLI
tara:strand:+ start:3809 stop:4420 length:612 start_codon:yes stop_codon:yes gene_type:complete